MKCFVTVGTTKFDDLLRTVCDHDFLKTLSDKGYSELIVQRGGSDWNAGKQMLAGIKITTYQYKPDIKEDIAGADLVISHAGAGSCLEIMYANKPCIVVVNDNLMGNHQTELAEQLEKLGHIKQTVPKELVSTLERFDASTLTRYEKGVPGRFAAFLSTVMNVE